MIKRLFGLLVLVAASPVSAQVSQAGLDLVRVGANAYEVRAAPSLMADLMSRTVDLSSLPSSTSPTSQIRISDRLVGTGPAGSLPLTATRTVSGLGAARAIASAAARGVAPIAMGLTAYELVQAYRMRNAANGLEQDIGIEGSDTIVAEYKACDNKWMPSASAAAQSCAAYINSQGQAGTYTYADGTVKPNTALGRSVNDPYWGLRYVVDIMKSDGSLLQANFRQGGVSTRSTTKRGCTEAATGAFTPAGADGRCPTGRYEGISLDQAATKLAPALTVAAVAEYVNSNASKADPVEESKPMTVTGPAEQVGPPKTTTRTGPAGTISETVTPTYQYNYAGNTITYNTTNTTVTNVTNNEGDTETTTETKPEETQKGDCELYPKSVGCLELGEPAEEEIPEQERSVDISPESVDLPSGCPADVALPGGRVLSYASACAAAVASAPLVIAAGVLSALLIAVAAIRGS